uniref:Uncharacterized protein n=1 Tax=Rhizophora mucronata TaxID=61149 RepID=A0A2P2JIV5_RHIMU
MWDTSLGLTLREKPNNTKHKPTKVVGISLLNLMIGFGYICRRIDFLYKGNQSCNQGEMVLFKWWQESTIMHINLTFQVSIM